MKTNRSPLARRRGMTLIELLIAFSIFVLLVAALVALGTEGLDTWQQGEARKDIYDRAQRLLDQLSGDLRCATADDQWYFVAGNKRREPAAMIGDIDRNQNQRLRFVRSGRREELQADPAVVLRPPPSEMYYSDLWEVVYAVDTDPEVPALHRAVRYFDRPAMQTAAGKPSPSLLVADTINDTRDPAFRRHDRVIDEGVLWIGFKYWTQYTTTWADRTCWVCPVAAHASAQQQSEPGRCQVRAGDRPCDKDLVQVKVVPVERAARTTPKLIAPLAEWDSTRVTLPRFYFHKALDLQQPDFVYPEIIQVTLVLETTALEARGTRLAESVDERSTSLRVLNARDLPEGPAMAKVGAEWIAYDRKRGTDLESVRRGQRGTKAAIHPSGCRVRFGETFVADLRVPAFREAVLR